MIAKKVSPMRNYTPWAWVIEPTHGCNLSCGHCSCALDPLPKTYHFMDEETWVNAWKIVAVVSPTCRMDLCLGGEPTLHPDLLRFLQEARRISPRTQIQITTNGTKLLDGTVEYGALIQAGANIVYTDMYGPRERYFDLAEKAGVQWYEYYKKPDSAPSPWTYHGPHLKLIVLQEHPENWPKSRYKAGLLGTWYNHLDWEKAKRFGLSPVVSPPKRRCNQPFRYVPMDSHGNYLLCCQDNTGETAGKFGNVASGNDGFVRYWLGKTMQEYRIHLMNKDRASNPECSRCCITFSRCDYKHWTDDQLSRYWDGSTWVPI